MIKEILVIILLALTFNFKVNSQDTFSIVAVDSITGEVGSAGASCVDLNEMSGFSDDQLGELFPGVGAINTQAWYLQSNQINARDRMNNGETPNQIIQWLIANDATNQPELRQYGISAIVNGIPESASHTGSSLDDYKNHITGTNYSIQGNLLLSQEVLESMEANFLNSEGDLACKLMAALQGANIIGADKRCTSNGTSSLFAFIKVAQPTDPFGNPSFLLSVRTKMGDDIEPIDSLQTIFNNEHNGSSIGIDESNSISHFFIYPNPANNQLTIETTSHGQQIIEITSLNGQLLYKRKIERPNLKIELSAFQKGVYFITVRSRDYVRTEKIIKM